MNHPTHYVIYMQQITCNALHAMHDALHDAFHDGFHDVLNDALYDSQ